MFYLVRTESSGFEIWHQSLVMDDLSDFLKICRENWVGSFEILPEFEVEAQRHRFQAKDYVRFFRS